MNAIAVIGAGFGDEGKGLMTDYFSSAVPGTVVVRYNGGANAGHTVVTPCGKRHVFRHFGSGTLAGAATFLSRFFVVNPILFRVEAAELYPETKGPLYVGVSKYARVTTPFDMIINQACAKDNTTGNGLHETMVRCDKGLELCVKDLAESSLKSRLEFIRSTYLPARLKELGIALPEKMAKLASDPKIIQGFLDAVNFFLANTTISRSKDLTRFHQIVFEGAQGLLLDASHKFFPHVTHSNTGLQNIKPLMKSIGLKRVEAVYTIRSYLTRHGAGPFPTEDSNLKYEDGTNINNPMQGPFRFGYMDWPLVWGGISKDIEAHGRYGVDPCLAVTHADQCEWLEQAEMSARFISNGPTRMNVQVIPPAM